MPCGPRNAIDRQAWRRSLGAAVATIGDPGCLSAPRSAIQAATSAVSSPRRGRRASPPRKPRSHTAVACSPPTKIGIVGNAAHRCKIAATCGHCWENMTDTPRPSVSGGIRATISNGRPWRRAAGTGSDDASGASPSASITVTRRPAASVHPPAMLSNDRHAVRVHRVPPAAATA